MYLLNEFIFSLNFKLVMIMWERRLYEHLKIYITNKEILQDEEVNQLNEMTKK